MAKKDKPRRLGINRRDSAKLQKKYASSREAADARNAANDAAARAGRAPTYGPTLETRGVSSGDVSPLEDWELDQRVLQSNTRAANRKITKAQRLAMAQAKAAPPPIPPPRTEMDAGFHVRYPANRGTPPPANLALRGRAPDQAEEGFRRAQQEAAEADLRTARGEGGIFERRSTPGGEGPERWAPERSLAIRQPAGKLALRTITQADRAPITEKLISEFTGKGLPITQAKVRTFLGRIVGLGKELPNNVAQQIANKMSAIPKAKAAEYMTKIANGVREAVDTAKWSGQASKSAVLGPIMEFFEVSDSTLGRVASSAGRMARTAYGASKSALQSPAGGLAAFGMANALRTIRQGKQEQTSLEVAGALQPSVEDMVQQSMLEEFKMRSRMKMAGKAGGGGGLSSAGLEALLGGGGGDEGPMRPVSLPPSSGFPVPE